MPRQKTHDMWLDDFRTVHGNRYDYINAVITRGKDKIAIICSEHGEFEQTPENHRQGKGCRDCSYQQRGDSRRYTNDEFVDLSRKVHNDFYDYSKVEYVNYHKKVVVVCPVHGPFNQSPAKHLSGQGCKYCGYASSSEKQRCNREEFIAAAVQVHGELYDYSKVEYISALRKVVIGCYKHGSFPQTPDNHLKKKGCPRCRDEYHSQRMSSSTPEFILKAVLLHGERYNYDNVIYGSNSGPVVIVCTEHGAFCQTPSNHLAGSGCPLCGDESCSKKLRSNTVEFIEKAKLVHGEQYDYTLVEYTTTSKKVEIVCRQHGQFQQIAGNHLDGKGCPGCAETGFSMVKPAITYFITVTDNTVGQVLYKVGVTNRSVAERFSGADAKMISVDHAIHFDNGRQAYVYEQYLLNKYNDLSYEGPPVLSSGNTELFEENVFLLEAAGNTPNINNYLIM